MKVLWFTNTPANATQYLSNTTVTGGWLSALDQAIQDNLNIELSVAFYWEKRVDKFRYKLTNYYPIYSKAFGRNKWLIPKHKRKPKYLNEEDIELYLKIIDEVSPDIIHIHGTEMPFGYIQERVKIPVVFSIQGILCVYKLKYFSGFTIKTNSFRNSLLARYYKRDYKRFVKMAEREEKILQKAQFVIGRTSWDRDVCSILAPSARYFHNDELLRSTFFKHEWKINDKPRVVLHSSIGTSLYKGLETVIQTAVLLKPHIDFEWNIAGISANSYINRYLEKYTNINIPNLPINFLGVLNSEALIDAMLGADIFIHPSHIENSSNSICEAMALGMPIICTHVGGTPDILTHNHDGILIQDGDPYALAGSILRLVENKPLVQILGRQSRKTAMGRHSKDKVVSELQTVYQSCVDSI